jgi:hypothetical protein
MSSMGQATFIFVYLTTFQLHTDFIVDHGAGRSRARTVFARSNAGIVVSNTTQGINVCVCVCVVLCVGSGVATC